MIEKTLIIVKHDGVLKGLIGEVIKRFENMGLKVAAMKMVWANEEVAKNHYQVTDEWANNVFTKAKESYEKQGKEFEFDNAKEYAGMIQSWNVNFLKEGPVVAIVFEGPHAVELGRKLVGDTQPRTALPGTIRGDFAYESYQISDVKKRPVRNIVHASGAVDEAEREIQLWFNEDEIHEYPHPLDKHIE